MNIVKSLVLVGCAFVCSPVVKQNEIVINKGNDNYLTISWDMVSEDNHFSIENENSGLIKDAFIISRNKHYQDGFSWYILNIEGWQNENEYWFKFELGL